MILKQFNYLLAFLLIGSSLALVSCNKTDEESLKGDWTRLQDLEGKKRCEAVSFVIGDLAYILTGSDDEDNPLKDMYCFNTQKGSWLPDPKASLPAAAKARYGAVAFSIGNIGYVGTGYDNDNYLNDFWAYDSTNDTWTQIPDLPGPGRRNAVAFAVNGRGYVATGYDDNVRYQDTYEYNPENKTWTKIGLMGRKIQDAAAFVIGNKAYVVTGTEGNGVLNSIMYVFDGDKREWIDPFPPKGTVYPYRNTDNSNTDESYDDLYTTINRTGGSAFAINGKGYIVGGLLGGSAVKNVWEYDPATDLWQEKTSFTGNARTESVGFAVGNYGYLSTGRSGSMFFDDMARFDPTAEDDEKY